MERDTSLGFLGPIDNEDRKTLAMNALHLIIPPRTNVSIAYYPKLIIYADGNIYIISNTPADTWNLMDDLGNMEDVYGLNMNQINSFIESLEDIEAIELNNRLNLAEPEKTMTIYSRYVDGDLTNFSQP